MLVWESMWACVCCPGMDKRNVTHGDSALLLAVVVAFFFGGFFTVLVVCWREQQDVVVKKEKRKSINTFYGYNKTLSSNWMNAIQWRHERTIKGLEKMCKQKINRNISLITTLMNSR